MWLEVEARSLWLSGQLYSRLESAQCLATLVEQSDEQLAQQPNLS